MLDAIIIILFLYMYTLPLAFIGIATYLAFKKGKNASFCECFSPQETVTRQNRVQAQRHTDSTPFTTENCTTDSTLKTSPTARESSRLVGKQF